MFRIYNAENKIIVTVAREHWRYCFIEKMLAIATVYSLYSANGSSFRRITSSRGSSR
jgi:hypothetical protein